MFLVIVVFCQAEVSATGRSFVQRSPTGCGVSECDPEISTMRLPRFEGSCAIKKNILELKEIFRHLRKIANNNFQFLYVCPSVRLSVCLSVCLYVCLSVRLSVRPSVCPSVCLSVRLSLRMEQLGSLWTNIYEI